MTVNYTANSGAGPVADTIQVIPVVMKLEQVGDTVISKDANGNFVEPFSEDTTVRVTAVNAATGTTLTTFTGTVEIAELGTSIYSQNTNLGAELPDSVTISTGGSAEFTVKSLAGPKVEGTNGEKPDAAIIVTTNFPVRQADPSRPPHLEIEQWVDLGQLHTKSLGPAFDWAEARAKDIFGNSTGDAATVLDKISNYMVVGIGDAGGRAPAVHEETTVIIINPFFTEWRLDRNTIPECGVERNFAFKYTMLHEARHAYQNFLTTQDFANLNPAPQDDDPLLEFDPNNDDDEDFLVDIVTIFPNDFIVDSTSPRLVCQQPNTIIPGRTFKEIGRASCRERV